ncbi:hypothetical protein DPEC_G00340370 [Dallia pectoralis]|uniref:Uncharacterized protein n=1 Tax=Dallia pectoralis TaxID=75939 RepID=A0ACC2F540_DALPE|nr:hypothetical protein DPEC_G00340370 [Dallia pectoralis]
MTNVLGLGVVDFLWLSLASGFLLAFCVHRLYLPTRFEKSKCYIFFQDLIRYGKTKGLLKREHWLHVFDIPKRWFWHFYAISIGWNGLLIVLSFHVIVWDEQFPSWLTDILRYLTGGPVAVKRVPQVSTVLVLLMLWVHSLRRLLECHFVSVFSDGVIHIVQYLFGLAYYILLGLTALCLDPLKTGDGSPGFPLFSQLQWYHVIGAVLFFWASLLQHRSLVLLAKLRTGGSGTVETMAHRVPRGGWFELVSCPHYFAELLIYASLGFVSAGHNLTWWLVVLYVLFNQALAAQLCHEFYRNKFQSYPQHRKAFIPYLL